MDDRHFGSKQNFLEEALVGVGRTVGVRQWDQTTVADSLRLQSGVARGMLCIRVSQLLLRCTPVPAIFCAPDKVSFGIEGLRILLGTWMRFWTPAEEDESLELKLFGGPGVFGGGQRDGGRRGEKSIIAQSFFGAVMSETFSDYVGFLKRWITIFCTDLISTFVVMFQIWT